VGKAVNFMALDLQQGLQQAHALLDQLPPAKLRAVRSLLEVMIDDEELTSAQKSAIPIGSMMKSCVVPPINANATTTLQRADSKTSSLPC
jgi:hypothetical protein